MYVIRVLYALDDSNDPKHSGVYLSYRRNPLHGDDDDSGDDGDDDFVTLTGYSVHLNRCSVRSFSRFILLAHRASMILPIDAYVDDIFGYDDFPKTGITC